MPSGEIGVAVKNFQSTVDRCNEAETKNLSAIANRPGWNEKKKIYGGNFLRPIQKFEHKQ